MGDLQDGGSLSVELFEQLHDLLGLLGVQVASGLICQQQRGIVNDCARDANQLLLSAGELRRKQVLLADDVEAVQRIGYQRLSLGARHVLVAQRQIDVLGNCELVEQVIALEDHPHASLRQLRPLFAAHGVYRVAVEVVLAQPLVVEQSDGVQQRRLPCTGWSHQCDELAAFDFEVNAAQHPRLTGAGLVAAFEVAYIDHVIPSLFVAQCLHGIGLRCATRRQIAGGNTSDEENRGDYLDHKQDVVDVDAAEQAAGDATEPKRCGNA